MKMRLEDMITIEAKTEAQGQFMSEYRYKPAFLLHGCAGTGKTFIALYRALEEVLDLSVYVSAVLLELMEEYEVKYKKAYDILMEYFDEIPDEDKFTVHRRLKELKLWVK